MYIRKDEIATEDSGVGMPNQQVKQVFNPFFRGGTTRSGGHGVGLTIVKRLSDRFKWPIEINSTFELGTQVIVRFPDSHCEALTAEPESGLRSQ